MAGKDPRAARTVYSRDLRSGSPCFPKVYWEAPRQRLWHAYHDGAQGHLVNITGGQDYTLDPCENNSPFWSETLESSVEAKSIRRAGALLKKR